MEIPSSRSLEDVPQAEWYLVSVVPPPGEPEQDIPYLASYVHEGEAPIDAAHGTRQCELIIRLVRPCRIEAIEVKNRGTGFITVSGGGRNPLRPYESSDPFIGKHSSQTQTMATKNMCVETEVTLRPRCHLIPPRDVWIRREERTMPDGISSFSKVTRMVTAPQFRHRTFDYLRVLCEPFAAPYRDQGSIPSYGVAYIKVWEERGPIPLHRERIQDRVAIQETNTQPMQDEFKRGYESTKSEKEGIEQKEEEEENGTAISGLRATPNVSMKKEEKEEKKEKEEKEEEHPLANKLRLFYAERDRRVREEKLAKMPQRQQARVANPFDNLTLPVMIDMTPSSHKLVPTTTSTDSTQTRIPQAPTTDTAALVDDDEVTKQRKRARLTVTNPFDP